MEKKCCLMKTIKCHRCNGEMKLEIVDEARCPNGLIVIQVRWTCNNCGAWRGAIIGAGV